MKEKPQEAPMKKLKGVDELSTGKVNFKSTALSREGGRREKKMAQRQTKFLYLSNPNYSPIGQV